MEDKTDSNKNEIIEKEISVDEKTVQIVVDEKSCISLDDFQANDRRILSLLNQDSDLVENKYTFNGLARKLGIHQQSLARSLHRLESSGLVEKTELGYRLAKNLRSILVKKSQLDLENLSKTIPEQNHQFVQVLQLYITSSVNVEDLVCKLSGKWFGNLRWIGLIEGDGGYLLQWISREKYQVNLKLVSRYAIIESNASGEKDRTEAMMSAYRIFEQITLLQKTAQDGTTNLPTSFSRYN